MYMYIYFTFIIYASPRYTRLFREIVHLYVSSCVLRGTWKLWTAVQPETKIYIVSDLALFRTAPLALHGWEKSWTFCTRCFSPYSHPPRPNFFIRLIFAYFLLHRDPRGLAHKKHTLFLLLFLLSPTLTSWFSRGHSGIVNNSHIRGTFCRGFPLSSSLILLLVSLSLCLWPENLIVCMALRGIVAHISCSQWSPTINVYKYVIFSPILQVLILESENIAELADLKILNFFLNNW